MTASKTGFSELQEPGIAHAPVPAVPESVVPTSPVPRVKTRVVREAMRDTWFVVNESDDDLATIPIETSYEGRSIRRVIVNAEAAEFSASSDLLMVRPRLPLRRGSGTIVVVHFR